MTMPLRSKDRDALLQSLRAGVVPRVGQQLIQVGRSREIESVIRDVERIAEGGSAFRVVIGPYGAGKSFFLNLVRGIALEKKLVVAQVDLTPDRRLQASGGQARALYAELMHSLATRTKPDGGALPAIVEKFITTSQGEAAEQGRPIEQMIRQKLEQLRELPGGYDFAEVIAAYWRGHDQDQDSLKSDAVRWLRGEFSTKTDARHALGVRSYVDDAAFYGQLKLIARFVRLAGYGGLLICLDEMVNLYKIANSQARNANYEQILGILNDSLQGAAVGLGFMLGGTPEFLQDPRRGLYSYPALESRLAQNRFVTGDLVDFSGPELRLASLTPEDFYQLLYKLRQVFYGDAAKSPLLPDAALTGFMDYCAERIGDAYFRSPRNTITSFLNLLAVLEQNPTSDWLALLGRISVTADTGNDANLTVTTNAEQELASFKL
ncbi:MAG: ATP-binding protein [Alphaproteobacteria bacterium]|nr:ATP-binding protein [Alphaproteobacteria bacterium]